MPRGSGKKNGSASAKKPATFELGWDHIYIIILPVAVVGIQQLILWAFSQKGIPVEPVKLEAHHALEASKRLYLLSVAYLYFLVCFLVIGKILWDLYKMSSKEGSLRIGAGLAFLLCVSLVVAAISFDSDGSLNISIIGESWFRLALDGKQICLASEPKHVCFNWGFDRFINLLDIATFITAFTIPVLIIGVISCLDTLEDMDGQQTWIIQTRRFKNYMFACSAVLILGVLFFKTWTSYPGVTVGHKDDAVIRMGLESLSSSMTMLTGITYTLVLASFSLPVGYILNQRAKELASRLIGKEKYSPQLSEKVEEKRKSSGLTLTTMELVQSVIALLAPLLTGAFSGMLGSLS